METRITVILVDKRVYIIIYDIWFIYDNIIGTVWIYKYNTTNIIISELLYCQSFLPENYLLWT